MTRAFLDSSGPIAFAHRGGAGEAPENTLEAFAAAVALGYRYLETDVHATRDGTVVAFHDPRLDRVSDRRGHIARLTMDDIRAADAGFWFTRDEGSSYPLRGSGHRVPTLEELLTRWPHVLVNIDMKTEASVAPLAALLERLDACDRVCVASFNDARLARFRALTGGRVCTSMGRRAVTAARIATVTRRRVPRLDADCVQVPVRWGACRVVDAALVAGAHRSGLAVHVWTVNDEASMHGLLDLGVDGIMTDRPRLLRDVLVGRGQWHAA